MISDPAVDDRNAPASHRIFNVDREGSWLLPLSSSLRLDLLSLPDFSIRQPCLRRSTYLTVPSFSFGWFIQVERNKVSPYVFCQSLGFQQLLTVHQVLVVVACLSLIAIIALLSVIAVSPPVEFTCYYFSILWFPQFSAFNSRTSLDEHLFVRTHVAAYFISLLLCDLLQCMTTPSQVGSER